jgi:preprotein translocase subunit SecF
MMQWIKPGTKIDFVGQMRIWVGISLGMIFVSICSFFVKELNYGIDFAGGTEVHVKFASEVKPGEVRDVISGMGFSKNVIQSIGSGGREYLLRVENFSSLSDAEAKEIRKKFAAEIGEENVRRFRFGSETGDKIDLKTAKAYRPEELAAVFQKLGLHDISVRPEGKSGDNQYLVVFSGVVKKIESELVKKFPGNKAEIIGVEAVGAQVGKQLRTDGFLAIIYSIIAILIYVALRFDVRFAPGAVFSLVHDAIFIIGLFNILNLDFDMTILAAVLTLLGYSINDTIVVYDRIRENLPKYKNLSLAEIVNLSVNETLSRTLMTSFTVALVAGSLLFLGGHSLFGFALAMFVGVLSGTYSSVFIAAPVTIALENWYSRVRKA